MSQSRQGPHGDVLPPVPSGSFRSRDAVRTRLSGGAVLAGCAAHLRAVGAAVAVAVVISASAAQACADLALVLAIDASGSVNDAEFRLQQEGYARALLSPRVQASLAAAGDVDVGVVIWGDSDWTAQVLPLVRLDSADDVLALAQQIATLPRGVSGNTGIGRGVWMATDLLEAQAACAVRRVINVSGDGVESLEPRPRRHVPLAFARERAVDAGITINGLAIETTESGLGQWYRDHLIGGPGAFVMQVGSYADFATGIETKMAREIAPAQLAALSALPP